jgi:uncharacterized membrane protein HdeD (DUF308 family)
MTETTPMTMCPMAETCRGMMSRRGSGLMFIVPGILFIILGVAVVMEPRILVWLVALALIVMGISILMMGSFMRRIGQRHLR